MSERSPSAEAAGLGGERARCRIEGPDLPPQRPFLHTKQHET